MTNEIQVTEWDGTPWAGEAKLLTPNGLSVITPPTLRPASLKAVTALGP